MSNYSYKTILLDYIDLYSSIVDSLNLNFLLVFFFHQVKEALFSKEMK